MACVACVCRDGAPTRLGLRQAPCLTRRDVMIPAWVSLFVRVPHTRRRVYQARMSSHGLGSRASPSPAQPSTGAPSTGASPASKQILSTFLQELSDAKLVALEDPDIAADLKTDARTRYSANREKRSRQKIDETVQAQASINSAACESEAEGESDEYGPSKRSRHGRSPSANPPSAATKDTSKTPPAKRSKKSHQQRAAKRHWWRRSQALSRNWVS